MMTPTPFEKLICPLDGQPLVPDEHSWRCPQGHSFDTARQGYVNLLPVQNKRSLAPGDSKEMVAARQRFLNAGHYQPIAQVIAEAVAQWLAQAPVPEGDTAPDNKGQSEKHSAGALVCLDAGCGEGYYLRQLQAVWGAQAHSRELALVGLDISKWAVLAAAKQSKQRADNTRWLVASNANIPLAEHSVDCLLSLFGFPVYPQFQRVLRPGGQLILAHAGPEHLRELRRIIYPVLKPETEKHSASEMPPGFQLVEQKHLRFTLCLADTDAIADLLAMTPHFYRASAEGRAKALALTDLQVTVDVQLTRLQAGQ